MNVEKSDFLSGTVKPIMVAYLGKDFDFSAAFEELDQNKVSCTRNMDICLNKIEVLFFFIFREVLYPGSS